MLYKRVSEQFVDNQVLEDVRNLVPADVLNDDDPLIALLKWFKQDFMKWTPTVINCPKCSSAPAMQAVVETGASWRLRKIETHTCPNCGYIHVFPRYAEIPKIAQTRTGRCSEWSMLFGAMIGSVGMPVRIVQDYLDHCWNEAYVKGRWVHIDSTLAFLLSLDSPHYYERNWGKKYLHVLAFDSKKVEDVTERYTEHLETVLQRRAKSDSMGFDEKVFLPESLMSFYAKV